jgi:DNA-binding IclR family transcriptional regulator
MRIAAEARPFLRDLMLRTGLRAHLAMYRGGGVVYIDRVDNAATLNQFVPIGRRAHAHATGLGKALLAHASEDELAAFLAHNDLRKFTPTTLSDAGALRDELAAVRRRGFALDRGESHADTRCVAAPVFDYTGRAIAAISVAGMANEVEPRSSDLAQIVMELAGAISQQFGYRSSGQPLFPGRESLFVREIGPANASQSAFEE